MENQAALCVLLSDRANTHAHIFVHPHFLSFTLTKSCFCCGNLIYWFVTLYLNFRSRKKSEKMRSRSGSGVRLDRILFMVEQTICSHQNPITALFANQKDFPGIEENKLNR